MNASNKRKLLLFAVVSLVFLTVGSNACLADEVTILTPRKTVINAYLSEEMPPDDITNTDLAYAKIINDNRWKAVIKSSSSSQYNSHGYAWRVYAGGEAVIIDDKDVPKFWMDGSYEPIKRHEAVRGDIVVMTDPAMPDQYHSAVVMDARWCMSKWGKGPLVLHRLNDHPFGQTYQYFRRSGIAAPTGLTIISSN